VLSSSCFRILASKRHRSRKAKVVRERNHRMIVYEPPGDLRLPSGSRIRKRELASFVADVATDLSLEGTVSVLLTGDAQIRELNRRFRKKDKATDVLSFPAAREADAKNRLAGDLAVSLETAIRQASEMGHTLEAELKILLLHGLLHLAGLDHETDTGAMRRKENRLRRRFGLPLTLIERNSPAAPRPAAAKQPTGPKQVRSKQVRSKQIRSKQPRGKQKSAAAVGVSERAQAGLR
jgi:probable rRNA maturation factor